MDLLLETWLLTFGLILARVSAFIMTIPYLGGRYVPKLIKSGTVLALTCFWFSESQTGSLAAVMRMNQLNRWLGFAIAVRRIEVIIGCALGYVFGLFIVPVPRGRRIHQSGNGTDDGNDQRSDAARIDNRHRGCARNTGGQCCSSLMTFITFFWRHCTVLSCASPLADRSCRFPWPFKCTQSRDRRRNGESCSALRRSPAACSSRPSSWDSWRVPLRSST